VLGAALLASLGLVLAGTFDVHNNDTFGHLAQGRQIVELGYVPSVDTFSFWRDEPQPWHNYEWGTDLIFWVVYNALGTPGLLALKGLLLGGVALFLFGRAADARRARSLAVLITAALILWAIPAARFRLTMRPELFGYFFCALYVWGLGRLASGRLDARARHRWIVGLVLSHVSWVNLHGSHLLGVAIAGMHLLPLLRAAGPRRDLLLVLGGFAVASCISPYGPAIVVDAIVHVADPVYRELVREWAPWSENDPLFYLVALVAQTLLLASAAITLYRGDRADRAALLTAALLAIVGFRSLRFVATFLLLSAPLIATGLSRVARVLLRRRADMAVAGAFAVSVVAAGWLTSELPPDHGIGIGLDESRMPVAAARVLEEDLPGSRVLAPVQTSWYLMFASPSSRFLVDGRVPFYGPAHMAEIHRAMNLVDQFEPLLVRYRVDALVFDFATSETQLAIANAARTEGYYPLSIENDHVLFAALMPGREGIFERRAFRALPPLLDPRPLLDPQAPIDAMRAEITRLEESPHTDAIRGWYEGVIALRGLWRGEGAGFRAPDDEASRTLADRASRDLDRAAPHYPLVPIVHSYRALAAVAACRPEVAFEAAEGARRDGGDRVASLATVEMALRTGDEGPARELLSAATSDPALADDPWLAAIRRDLEAGVRCR